jgi:hypothetical protein
VQPSPTSDIVDLLPVDHFVVPSSACLKWRRDQYKAEKLAAYRRVEFEHVPSPIYREWSEAGRRVVLPDVVKTAMIVGFPPNWIRYAYRAGHWGLTQLDVEIALIEVLRASGLRVLYKAHPEWEADLKYLYSGLDCEFIGGRFEECWQQADAFIFPRTSSTSFGFAICTNRPIILLDVKGQKWQEEAYRLIARRCRMVPAEIDSNLRIRFDPEALVAAVRQRVTAPDQGYVLQAMCG